jgi:hypothetical protein
MAFGTCQHCGIPCDPDALRTVRVTPRVPSAADGARFVSAVRVYAGRAGHGAHAGTSIRAEPTF